MAIADRINEMYTHVGDVYDTITNVDLPTNKNIQNIPQTIKDSYLEIMNNGIDTIWNNWEKVTGEGTSLTLNNTYQAPMRNNLKGNTSQTGTPTPTSPIPVNVVSGDNEINVLGKNLFDKTRLISGKRLDNTGLPSIPDNTYCTTDYFIKVEPNTTYYSTSTINQSKAVCFYDSRQTFIERKMYLNAHTFTTGATTQFIKISILLSEIDTEQLEKGSSASTYEPYQGNTYNIDLPVENLFDKSTAVLNKMITGSGGLIDFTGVFSSDYIKVQPSTAYYVNEYMPTVVAFDENKNAIGYIRNASGSATFTTPNNCEYIRARMFDASIDMTTALNNAMLEKGTKGNSYTPYGTTPIELCKIGTYQDYFYKDSDKWYLHKEIGKVVLNGSETWTIFNSNNTRTAFRINISDIEAYTNGDNTPNLLSNRFIPISYNGSWVTGKLSRLTQNNVQNALIVIYNPNTSVEDFKTWLASNNTIVYYVLATPTNTEITYQPLIDQLNALEQAKSKENQTNISQINNDLGFIISASALKKG